MLEFANGRAQSTVSSSAATNPLQFSPKETTRGAMRVSERILSGGCDLKFTSRLEFQQLVCVVRTFVALL